VISPDTVAQVEQLRVLEGHSDRIYGLDFASDGQRLASGGRDRTLRLWDQATRQPIALS